MFVPFLSLISISSYVVQGTKETGNIHLSGEEEDFLLNKIRLTGHDAILNLESGKQ